MWLRAGQYAQPQPILLKSEFRIFFLWPSEFIHLITAFTSLSSTNQSPVTFSPDTGCWISFHSSMGACSCLPILQRTTLCRLA